MKKTILLMLPFALGLAACSGGSPLDKGNIITEAFMKRNFIPNELGALGYEKEFQTKVEIGNYNFEGPLYAGHSNFGVFSDADGKLGVYSFAEGKFIVQPDDYDVLDYEYANAGIGYVYFAVYGKTDAETGVTSLHFVDDFGSEVFAFDTEEPGSFSAYGESLDSHQRKSEKEVSVVFCDMDDCETQFAVYDYEGTITRKGKLSEYVAQVGSYYDTIRNMGSSMEEYGHPELIEIKTSSYSGAGTRFTYYNADEGKFVSSFEVPDAAEFYYAGDYIVCQQYTAVEERATEYDLFYMGGKVNVDTYRINYTNGALEQLETKVIFGMHNNTSFADKVCVDEKGIVKYWYIEDATVIREDKAPEGAYFGFILNDKAEVAADVTGIDFANLVYLNGYYVAIEAEWDVIAHVYDGQLHEVAALDALAAYYMSDDELHLYVSNQVFWGLIDHDGKVLLPATYAAGSYVGDGVYQMTTVGGKSVDFYKVENHEAKLLKSFSEEDWDLTSFTQEDAFGFTCSVDDLAETPVTHTFFLDTFEETSFVEIPAEDTPVDAIGPTGSFCNTRYAAVALYQTAAGSTYFVRDALKFVIGYPTYEEAK